MSLASNNSHYHTTISKEKFKKFKLEGSEIKEKCLKGDISKMDFKKWIESSYHSHSMIAPI